MVVFKFILVGVEGFAKLVNYVPPVESDVPLVESDVPPDSTKDSQIANLFLNCGARRHPCGARRHPCRARWSSSNLS